MIDPVSGERVYVITDGGGVTSADGWPYGATADSWPDGVIVTYPADHAIVTAYKSFRWDARARFWGDIDYIDPDVLIDEYDNWTTFNPKEEQ